MTQLEKLLKAIRQRFWREQYYPWQTDIEEEKVITVGELVKILEDAIKEEKNILSEKDSEIKKDWEE